MKLIMTLLGFLLIANETYAATEPYTKAYSVGRSVVYVTASGHKTMRSGGSRAWRNNNPGNIGRGESQIGMFKAGNEGTGSAIFATREDGERDLRTLVLFKFGIRTIPQMMKFYAPLEAERYSKFLLKRLKISESKKIHNLTYTEFNGLIESIILFEGWKVGKVTEYRPDRQTPHQAVCRGIDC